MAPATASELLDMLAWSLSPPRGTGSRSKRRQWWPGGLFIREIEAPQQYRIGPRGGRYPLKTRRADAIWVPHNRGEIHGYEVKVSRDDLKAELDDPAKCVAWKQYCDFWHLVIPGPGLIEGFEIPEDWGILGPPSQHRKKAMTPYRKAPKLTPIDQTPALFRLATSGAFRHHTTQKALDAALADIEHLKEIVEDQNWQIEMAA